MSTPNPAQTWHPSALGKHVTKARDWRLTLTGPDLIVTVDGEPVTRKIGSFGGLTVTPGRVWAHLELEHPDRRFRFRGIPNRRAASGTPATRGPGSPAPSWPSQGVTCSPLVTTGRASTGSRALTCR
ncbi:hypothetical protein E3T48_16325 [Cryobacterium fucosi]|uniref:Uncharacterized protein n=1 Tax=Cryobacterium fucosi TaxID=1259157 RepID=A0A4R9AUP5_9MICO|nr:hypothetical protein E3T48_16325 [Cryobacterium fucosi]